MTTKNTRQALYGLALTAGLGLALAGPALAQTKTLLPTVYYNTYSDAHPPQFQIKPGETIFTKTLDSSGYDEKRERKFSKGIGLTGPFYIEGAEPGDQLVVHLNKVETNRDTGFSGSLLAPYTTEPADLLARVDRQGKLVTWLLDKKRNVGTLKETELEPGGIELPLRPMLGCIGVAAAQNAAPTSETPGAWGGNMDYVGVETGATLMFPVNVAGALLYMGDAHARMGEGEVVKTGMETSMDVTFTVELIKGKKAAWPRIEDKEEIKTVGSSRDLLAAFQASTAELHRWLMADYGMTDRGAAMLMGQAARYEVAQVVDPSFTIVAKMPKKFLPKK
jgi:amidase